MITQVLKYNDQTVEFQFNKQNVMVNATEMAKIFGKEVEPFMRNESTKNFISACLKTENSRFLSEEKNQNFGFLNLESEEDLIISKQKSGTWMHRILALKFAAWLNPDFEVWVYSAIETLLFGRHLKREQSFEKTISLQREMDDLRDKPDKTGADFDRYLEIQRDLKRETTIAKPSLPKVFQV